MNMREIYLSLGISLTCSFVTVSGLFCWEVFEIFLLASLLPIKSQVAPAVFFELFFSKKF